MNGIHLGEVIYLNLTWVTEHLWRMNHE